MNNSNNNEMSREILCSAGIFVPRPSPQSRIIPKQPTFSTPPASQAHATQKPLGTTPVASVRGGCSEYETPNYDNVNIGY